MSKFGITIACIAILLVGAFYLIPSLRNSYKILPGILYDKTTTSSDKEDFSTWQDFIPRSGLFKVLLPHTPQYAKDLVSIPDSDKKRRYDMYASEKIDGTLFLISVITYPSEVDTKNSHEILNQTVNELMQSNVDNRLISRKEIQFEKYPAVDFSMNNRDFHVQGRAILVDKIVYVVSYITRKNDFDPVEYQHFIDSFELLKR